MMRAGGLCLFLLVCGLCIAPVQAAELYRWVDAQGQIHISDSLPPGQTVYTTLTPKGAKLRDVAPVPAALSQDLTAQKMREQQAARLRQLYASEADLKAQRDQRLDDIQSTLRFSLQQRASLVSQLAELKVRESAFAEAGKTIPPVLQKQIRQSEANLAAHERAIAQRQRDLEQASAFYEADLEAYHALIEAPTTPSDKIKNESASPPLRP